VNRPRLAWLLVPGLLLLPITSAQAFDDRRGDADGPDLVEVSWSLDNGTARLSFQLAADRPGEGAVRGLLLLGTPGEADPAEWYAFTLSDDAAVNDGLEGGAVTVLASGWNGSVGHLSFERTAAAPAPCSFVAVEVGMLTGDGFSASDVVPDGLANLESAWPVEACPPSRPAGSAPAAAESEDAPLGAVALAAVAIGLIMARRR
jgi:hypothetical protein